MLGKLEPKIDGRTFQLRRLLIAENLPPLLKEFDVDNQFTPHLIDNRMFANDLYGCCVISGQAHASLRYECFEQNLLINIADNEVVGTYLKQTGGADNGLYMLDSLNVWRKEGWIAGRKAYNIYAFAKLNSSYHDDVKYSIMLFRGVMAGLALPNSAKNQSVWDVSIYDGERGTWGGHCVYIHAYNETGPICMTWGRKQQMTWAFFTKYCDEAYAIIDNRNLFTDSTTNPLNCEKLTKLLTEVTEEPLSPVNPNPPNPSPTPPIPWYVGIVKFFERLWKAILKVFGK